MNRLATARRLIIVSQQLLELVDELLQEVQDTARHPGEEDEEPITVETFGGQFRLR